MWLLEKESDDMKVKNTTRWRWSINPDMISWRGHEYVLSPSEVSEEWMKNANKDVKVKSQRIRMIWRDWSSQPQNLTLKQI